MVEIDALGILNPSFPFLDSLSLVFFVTPFSLCTFTAKRSARRVFLAGDGRL
jgi:hypothetical protein